MIEYKRQTLFAVFTLFAGVLLTSLAGCDDGKKASSDTGKESERKVELVKIKLDKFKKEIDSHKGKVIVLDVWGFN